MTVSIGKWRKEITRVLENEGLRNVRIVQRKRHLHITAETRTGRPVRVVTSVTPSDRRTLLNLRSTIRNIVKRSNNTGGDHET